MLFDLLAFGSATFRVPALADATVIGQASRLAILFKALWAQPHAVLPELDRSPGLPVTCPYVSLLFPGFAELDFAVRVD